MSLGMPIKITPLQKHHGHHGGLAALGVLVASVAVLWLTHARAPTSPPADEPSTNTPVMPAAVATSETAAELPRQQTTPQVPRTHVIADGFAAYDERRTARVTPNVHGFLDKTRERALGRKVRQGEALAVIYSPEVYVATLELLAELRAFESQEALNTKRYQLLRWGMPRETLAKIERTMRPQAALPLVARVAGTVVAEQGKRQQLIEPSQLELFTITDPAHYCVYVEVPDADAPRVLVGATALLRVEGLARPIAAKVAYVFRRGEHGMRTVRIDVHSQRVQINPEARVSAKIPLAPAMSG